MKTWEIIKEAQEKGAKIRGEHWDTRSFIQWDGKRWIDEDGGLCGSTAIGTQWELYKEPIKTFGPDRAMYWLERGKMVKRKAWASGNTLIRDTENLRWVKGNGISALTDWFHDDWHICDKQGNYIPEPEVMK